MNLRNPKIVINKPLENEEHPLRIATFYTDHDFESFALNTMIHIVSVDYLVDNIYETNHDNVVVETLSNTTHNGSSNKSFGYLIKVLYQEK